MVLAEEQENISRSFAGTITNALTEAGAIILVYFLWYGIILPFTFVVRKGAELFELCARPFGWSFLDGKLPAESKGRS